MRESLLPLTRLNHYPVELLPDDIIIGACGFCGREKLIDARGYDAEMRAALLLPNDAIDERMFGWIELQVQERGQRLFGDALFRERSDVWFKACEEFTGVSLLTKTCLDKYDRCRMLARETEVA